MRDWFSLSSLIELDSFLCSFSFLNLVTFTAFLKNTIYLNLLLVQSTQGLISVANSPHIILVRLQTLLGARHGRVLARPRPVSEAFLQAPLWCLGGGRARDFLFRCLWTRTFAVPVSVALPRPPTLPSLPCSGAWATFDASCWTAVASCLTTPSLMTTRSSCCQTTPWRSSCSLPLYYRD